MPHVLTTFLTLSFISAALTWSADIEAADRFILLNDQGTPISNFDTGSTDRWSCVLDQQTGLIWEVKTRKQGLHYQHNTYSWFNPDHTHNGGLAGYPGEATCYDQPCDTNNFIEKVNQYGWCNAHDWRLPTREELRSLVDYNHQKGVPALNNRVFPNAANQFYWSADPSASNPDEAWGIGFAFGFDYTYFKNNRVHVHLVRNKKLLASRGSLK